MAARKPRVTAKQKTKRTAKAKPTPTSDLPEATTPALAVETPHVESQPSLESTPTQPGADRANKDAITEARLARLESLAKRAISGQGQVAQPDLPDLKKWM